EDCSIDAITAAGNAFAGSLRDKLARYHRHVDCAFFGWHDSWLASGFRDWNVSEAIDHWKVPCLAIQGLDDPYGTRAQVDVIAKRQSPSSTVHLLERCQHAPHQEQAEQTMALIMSFAEACLDPSGR
ncbi:MAG: alpha/beta hydrolase, partial [Pseudomonadota bacterium]